MEYIPDFQQPGRRRRHRYIRYHPVCHPRSDKDRLFLLRHQCGTYRGGAFRAGMGIRRQDRLCHIPRFDRPEHIPDHNSGRFHPGDSPGQRQTDEYHHGRNHGGDRNRPYHERGRKHRRNRYNSPHGEQIPQRLARTHDTVDGRGGYPFFPAHPFLHPFGRTGAVRGQDNHRGLRFHPHSGEQYGAGSRGVRFQTERAAFHPFQKI